MDSGLVGTVRVLFVVDSPGPIVWENIFKECFQVQYFPWSITSCDRLICQEQSFNHNLDYMLEHTQRESAMLPRQSFDLSQNCITQSLSDNPFQMSERFSARQGVAEIARAIR
jgi:hypothetical protein